MMALVEQPIAMATVMALERGARQFGGCQVFPDHADNAAAASGGHAGCGLNRRRESTTRRQRQAHRPAMPVMVLAVPMVMQWLAAYAAFDSSHCALLILPARRSSQYFQVSRTQHLAP
jgi:hypothetical protein